MIPESTRDTALVLGGGGAKGSYEIGVIEALEREKTSLQKENEALEGKIDEFFAKVRSLLPASGFERRLG